MEKIKLDSRTARRLLNTENCNVRIDLSHTQLFVTTASGIKGDQVFIPHENIIVPLTDITAIEYTDRFGSTSYIDIAW